MSNRKLVTYVHVNGVVYGPGDDVPADVAAQITNPSAWGDDSAPVQPAEFDIEKAHKGELEVEVARRNEVRADDAQIVVGGKGTVKDLRAALSADNG